MNQKKLIAVIDYGMGNLQSVLKATEHVADSNTKVVVTNDPKIIEASDAIIFPGQGAAKGCMQAINDSGIKSALTKAATEKPFLGICMGLQVLFSHSEENNDTKCLNIMPGNVEKFELQPYPDLKLPHMGWNKINQTRPHPMWHNIEQNSRFYFVHSYHVLPQDKNSIIGTSEHGIKFNACIANKNLFAIQAHPEKSSTDGLQLLKNFVAWNGIE